MNEDSDLFFSFFFLKEKLFNTRIKAYAMKVRNATNDDHDITLCHPMKQRTVLKQQKNKTNYQLAL